jgi:hypothetical protein
MERNRVDSEVLRICISRCADVPRCRGPGNVGKLAEIAFAPIAMEDAFAAPAEAGDHDEQAWWHS